MDSLRNRHEQISRIIKMRLRIELHRQKVGIEKDLRGLCKVKEKSIAL